MKTVKCPNCFGTTIIADNTTEFECVHCGAKHTIEPQGLPAYMCFDEGNANRTNINNDCDDLLFLEFEYCEAHPERALQSLLRLANSGNTAAYNSLGELYYSGVGVPEDKATAELYYSKAHQLGNVDATYSLGYMYLNGDGVPENVSKGINLLKQAADKNYARAYRQLGFLYFWDKKVPTDYQLSFEHMKRAADLGDRVAQTHVAQAYDGAMWGAPRRDAALAKAYYEKAMAQNESHAFWCLGNNHLLGTNGWTKDENKAFEYYKTAVELDYSKAFLSLALCYLRGTGTEKNNVLALQWLKKATDNGDEEAAVRYGIALASGIVGVSPEQWDEGRKIVIERVAAEPDDKAAQTAIEKITELENKYESWSLAVLSGDSVQLLSCACEPIYVEQSDLQLDGLKKAIDGCCRVNIAAGHVTINIMRKSERWDMCLIGVEEALNEFSKINFPNEKDISNLRITYAFKGIATFKLYLKDGSHTLSEAEECFEKAKPFTDEIWAKDLLPCYEEFKRVCYSSTPSPAPTAQTVSPDNVLLLGILSAALSGFGVLGIILGIITRIRVNRYLEENQNVTCGKVKVGSILSKIGLIFSAFSTLYGVQTFINLM